jgi:hypothetical protein
MNPYPEHRPKLNALTRLSARLLILLPNSRNPHSCVGIRYEKTRCPGLPGELGNSIVCYSHPKAVPLPCVASVQHLSTRMPRGRRAVAARSADIMPTLEACGQGAETPNVLLPPPVASSWDAGRPDGITTSLRRLPESSHLTLDVHGSAHARRHAARAAHRHHCGP